MVDPGDNLGTDRVVGAIRRIGVAGSTIEGEGCSIVVTLQTTRTDAPGTVKARTVAEGTCSLNVPCRIMEGIIGPGPVLRVGHIDPMAALATVPAYIIDPEVETRVGTRPARFSVTGLAGSQVLLGVMAVQGRIEIAAVYRMGHLSGAPFMAALAVITIRKTAGRGRGSLEVCSVAAAALGIT